MKTTRPYDMRARAETAERTRERILQATIEAGDDKPIAAIVLPDVAQRAGVTVQTVLRQFGSREGLLDAAADYAVTRVGDERVTPPGDVEAAVRVLFDHYEKRGDSVMRLLAQESWDDRARKVTDAGRSLHREWVVGVFEPLLVNRGRRDQDQLLDLLVVSTDVYTWKLLRRDRGLSRPAAERRVLRMLDAILESPEPRKVPPCPNS